MIELYYKNYEYKGANGEKKTGKNYYLMINGRLVPISQRWYEGDKHKTTNLVNSVTLSSIAKQLPDKE